MPTGYIDSKTHYSLEETEHVFNSIKLNATTMNELHEEVQAIKDEINVEAREKFNVAIREFIDNNKSIYMELNKSKGVIVNKMLKYIDTGRGGNFVPSMNGNMKKLDEYYNSIALPVTVSVIPKSILSIVNKENILYQADNLISPVARDLHLVTSKSEKGYVVTNVLDSF